MAVGIEGFLFDVEVHAGEAGAGDLLLPARGARAVEDDVGMVKRLGCARTDFDGLHPASGCNRDGQDEIPEDFGAVGGELVGLRDTEDQVGRAKLPFIAELGRLRGAPDALRGALLDPVLDELDFGVSEAAFLREFAMARFGEPGRHETAFGHDRDLRGMPFHVVVVEQGKRGRFAGAVTRGAFAIHQRRDLLIEGDVLWRLIGGAQRPGRQHQNAERKTPCCHLNPLRVMLHHARAKGTLCRTSPVRTPRSCLESPIGIASPRRSSSCVRTPPT